MKCRALLAIILVAALASPAPAHPLRRAERRFQRQVNAIRSDRGIAPLTHGDRLHRKARRHLARMMDCVCVFHSPKPPYCGYWSENAGIGFGVRSLVRAFMRSPGHRANILNPRFHRTGVAAGWRDGLLYVVQEFCA